MHPLDICPCSRFQMNPRVLNENLDHSSKKNSTTRINRTHQAKLCKPNHSANPKDPPLLDFQIVDSPLSYLMFLHISEIHLLYMFISEKYDMYSLKLRSDRYDVTRYFQNTCSVLSAIYIYIFIIIQ